MTSRGRTRRWKGPINATYAMTFSDCAYTLLVLMGSDLPVNDGFYRVIELVAPGRHVWSMLSIPLPSPPAGRQRSAFVKRASGRSRTPCPSG